MIEEREIGEREIGERKIEERDKRDREIREREEKKQTDRYRGKLNIFTTLDSSQKSLVCHRYPGRGSRGEPHHH